MLMENVYVNNQHLSKNVNTVLSMIFLLIPLSSFDSCEEMPESGIEESFPRQRTEVSLL
jgi:hypothetical protein